ncbi:PP2C family protein-serine/threonine phosphatase, partial [Leucobacter sp. M11]|uniref:PP2C family protein-serine/threonine phosphatase n=1 Tax=Leucobacter sp. M11 TaxID=2993565 RepID=UPI002D80D760
MMGRAMPVLDVAALTDTGRKRKRNEDAVLAEWPCFLVADGVGGSEAGDLASAAVVEAFRALHPGDRPGTLLTVRAAFARAERAVRAVADGTRDGAGSTLTGVILVEHEGELSWLVINVGDSRVYQHLGSELTQLTVDHSLLQEALDAIEEGTADGWDDLPMSNVITRALGADDSRPDTWLLPVVTGVRLLICSDGLHGELDDEQLRALLTMGGKPGSLVPELIRRANAAGGGDNISAIVVDVL